MNVSPKYKVHGLLMQVASLLIAAGAVMVADAREVHGAAFRRSYLCTATANTIAAAPRALRPPAGIALKKFCA